MYPMFDPEMYYMQYNICIIYFLMGFQVSEFKKLIEKKVSFVLVDEFMDDSKKKKKIYIMVYNGRLKKIMFYIDEV